MIFRTLSEDVYTLSIQIGESLEVDKYNSVFMEMMEQVDIFRSEGSQEPGLSFRPSVRVFFKQRFSVNS